MRDPYLYQNFDVLKNLADIHDAKELSCMEAEYTSLRLTELVISDTVSRFNFETLCEMHYYIFPNIYLFR